MLPVQRAALFNRLVPSRPSTESSDVKVTGARPLARTMFEARKDQERQRNRERYRRIAEEFLGRRLRRGEVVHHINGDFTDDRRDNLVVISSQAAHTILHHWLRCEEAGRQYLFPVSVPFKSLLEGIGGYVIPLTPEPESKFVLPHALKA